MDGEEAPRTLLDPNVELMMPLVGREDINHDTRIFRFGLPSPRHVLGLPVGQHVILTAVVNGERVGRKYTPISGDETPGFMDLLVKVYFRDSSPLYPAGGKLTQYMEAMRIGDEISMRGPTGRFQYRAPGDMIVRLKKDLGTVIPMRATKINMIAGGSGIAPMLQLIRHITADTKDSTRIALLFANKTEEDIVTRAELDRLAESNPAQFRVWYTVDRAQSDDWPYSQGYVSPDMIRQHLFPPSEDTATLVCGPKPMIKQAILPQLQGLGHLEERRFKF